MPLVASAPRAASCGTIFQIFEITPLGIPMITGPGAIATGMGLLVTVIAVQFVIDGVRPLLIDILQRATTGS